MKSAGLPINAWLKDLIFVGRRVVMATGIGASGMGMSSNTPAHLLPGKGTEATSAVDVFVTTERVAGPVGFTICGGSVKLLSGGFGFFPSRK